MPNPTKTPSFATKKLKQQRIQSEPITFSRCQQYILWHLSRQNLSQLELQHKITHHFGKDWTTRLQPPVSPLILQDTPDPSTPPQDLLWLWLQESPYQSDTSRAQSLIRQKQKYGIQKITSVLHSKVGPAATELVQDELQTIKDSSITTLCSIIHSKWERAGFPGSELPSPRIDPTFQQKLLSSLLRHGHPYADCRKALSLTLSTYLDSLP